MKKKYCAAAGLSAVFLTLGAAMTTMAAETGWINEMITGYT